MFWSKKKGDKDKKNKGLPDLSSSPRAIPSMKDYHKIAVHPEVSEESGAGIPSLPSFPDSPMKKGFSQSAIKDAVETEDAKNEHSEFPIPNEEEKIPLPPLPKKSKVVELEEWRPKQKITSTSGKVVGNKPVFVKLDKFESARESLEIIKEKLNAINDLLRTIREVKMREDQELSSWEKEIESIKARINAVNSEIFENYYG